MELQEYEDILMVYAIEVTKWLVSQGIKPEEAQDTVQDVFVKMLELDLIIPPSKLRSWMYRVSLRSYIDHYRRDKKYQEILSALTEELSVLAETSPDLHPFLARLKFTDRKLLEHFYYEGLSVKDLSVLTGNSVSKIKIDLYRARKKLKKILLEEGYDEWKI
ncbi:RNA polymerase sigma factor [Lactococcus allomyrinae]|uniref:RNA polymerase sigma factor n=2 Tax=Lactococcus allomyrinae TaxID=2419773 RepID=A0A387BIB7_9LACT|nr:RNA polymerase sigma factor [Lactococcus allomyrinae]